MDSSGPGQISVVDIFEHDPIESFSSEQIDLISFRTNSDLVEVTIL